MIRLLPGWIIVGIVLLILLPQILAVTLGAAGRVITNIPNWMANLSIGTQSSSIAPLFTSEVDYWANDIQRWSQTYNVDPNLLATVMQIESCGHDAVDSVAGAQGLFQVMPFHFDYGEDMDDPDTNAKRGANFLNECLGYANGDPGLALACYNGGPSVVQRPFNTWPAETQRYYTWGTAIYLDAQQNNQSSNTLQEWLQAGGQNLCSRAASRLGL
ncbi:MAG: transglycosylase SLT domain-containing protein [Anaerolineae bacterium]|nr:transglycosylase SLT domain-containing protein [Anaerolineae bacterium]